MEALRESMRGKSWKPTGREGDKILAVGFGKGGAKEKQKDTSVVGETAQRICFRQAARGQQEKNSRSCELGVTLRWKILQAFFPEVGINPHCLRLCSSGE